MSDIQALIDKVVAFRDERDWKQFHNAKDLAIALSIESSELLELFLWKDASEVDDKKLRDELADILCFALLLAHEKGIDVSSIITEKLAVNALKYPVDKAKGTAKKYNEL